MTLSIKGLSIKELAICAAFAAGLAAGQGKGSPSSITPSGGVSPGMLPSTGGTSLSGRFQVDDGSPPPDRVRGELVCNSVPRPQGYSDTNGGFSVQLGQSNLDETMDLTYSRPGSAQGSGAGSAAAPTSVDTIPRNLEGCEVRGALLGYRSDV